MNLELHLIQNFPPSNLNRSDTGTPKDCEFGGVRRARISSQCMKKAIRDYFNNKGLLNGSRGIRTKLVYEEVCKTLINVNKLNENEVKEIVKAVLAECGIAIKETKQTEYLLFIGKEEIQKMANILTQNDRWKTLTTALKSASSIETGDKKDGEPAKKKSTKKSKSETFAIPPEIKQEVYNCLFRKDLADIALFGRMLADIPKENVDAACQVAHAISTNRTVIEMDFFTAIDDLATKDKTGAAMMGTMEFDSACFYRYLNINLEQLKHNLNGNEKLVIDTVKAFVEAVILAIPSGKQNSTGAQNYPSLVIAVIRSNGFSSLANAFEKPVFPTDKESLVEASIDRLHNYWTKIVKVYPLDKADKVFVTGPNSDRISDSSLVKVDDVPTFITQIAQSIGSLKS